METGSVAESLKHKALGDKLFTEGMKILEDQYETLKKTIDLFKSPVKNDDEKHAKVVALGKFVTLAIFERNVILMCLKNPERNPLEIMGQVFLDMNSNVIRDEEELNRMEEEFLKEQ